MPLDQIDIDNYDIETGKSQEMSFIDHLEEFRWVMVRSIGGVLLASILVFLFNSFFIDKILFGPQKADFIGYEFLCKISNTLFQAKPLGLSPDMLCFSNELKIQNLKLAGQFVAHFQIAFIMGLVVAFPWVFWQFWLFIKPALYEKEQKVMRFMTFFAWLFFIAGVLFGYFLVLPFSLNFFANYKVAEGIANEFNLKDYISHISMTTLASGLMFEMPMVIFILSKLGLVGPKDLRTYRKHAFLGILVLSAIITPPDVISQFLITVPVYFLYELSIFISAWVRRKDSKEQALKTE